MGVYTIRWWFVLFTLLVLVSLGFSCNRHLIEHQLVNTAQPTQDQVAHNEPVMQNSLAGGIPSTPKERPRVEPEEGLPTEPEESARTEPEESARTEPEESARTEPEESTRTEPEEALVQQGYQDSPISQTPKASLTKQIEGSESLPDQTERTLPSFSAPTLDGWHTEPLWPEKKVQEPPLSEYPWVAVAVYNHSPVYDFSNRAPKMVGRIRHGTTIRAKSAGKKSGCSKGQWYEIASGGYVCTAEGFRVGKKAYQLRERLTMPTVSQVEPFLSGKVESGTPRFNRIPTLAEEQALAKLSEKKARSLDYVDKFLHGIYFIGIVDEIENHGRVFFRTSMGHYVHKDKVKVLEQSGMHGELLQSKDELPLAFVFGEARDVYQLREGSLHSLGTIEKHARFPVAGSYRYQDREYVIGPQQIAVLREEVRVAAWHAKPDGIAENAKWLHLNLAQQTFVAYEGSKPVLASLLSSGIKGRDTPTGLYRIDRKYITKTMSGPDDEEGWYEVGEVPWTFFYRGNYAVHGAYWHNVFGETRSHGCTNIPPADARWLFTWLEPALPEGWHAQFDKDDGWTFFTLTQVDIKRYKPRPAKSENQDPTVSINLPKY